MPTPGPSAQTCPRLDSSFAYCRRLCRRAKSSFPFTFRLLDDDRRRGMEALYAIMRVTDDIVDRVAERELRRVAIRDWRQRLDRALAGYPSHRLHPALVATVKHFGIDPAHIHAVIDGVESDLDEPRYQDFPMLARYCEQVASAVGLACVPIWGTRPGVNRADYLAPATAAGIAFQLTNILRDLKDDLEQGRVYLPEDDLERFGCPAKSWSDPSCRTQFLEMLRFQIARARQYYAASKSLIPMLETGGAAVFTLMTNSYEGILDRVEQVQDGILKQRVGLGKLAKLKLLARVLLS